MPARISSAPHLGPDELLAADPEILAQRRRYLVDRRDLALVVAGLFLDPDQHLGVLAEILDRHFAERQRIELAPQGADIGLFLGAVVVQRGDLEQDAALEIDAEIEALAEEHRAAEDQQGRRKRQVEGAELHKGNGRAGRHETEQHEAFSPGA